MPQVTDDQGHYLLTGYVPNNVLSIVGIALYGGLALVFWFRMYRKWKNWMLALTIGCTTMTIGFICRIPFHNQPGSLGIYIVQYMLILLSPCAFLAQDYVILPRLATWLGSEDCLFLPSRWIVRIFVWSDVITFFLQACGGGMTAVQSQTMQDVGHWVAIVGLILQLASFCTFLACAIAFGYRLRKRSPEKWSRDVTQSGPMGTSRIYLRWTEDWRVLYLAMLYTAIGILIRSIFRIFEFAQGYDGKLRTVEWYFYVFDALPILLAIVVYAFVWPPNYLPEDARYFVTAPSVQGHSNLYGMEELRQGSSGSSADPMITKH